MGNIPEKGALLQVTAYQPPEIDLNGSRKYTSSGELDMDMKVLGSCILLRNRFRQDIQGDTSERRS